MKKIIQKLGRRIKKFFSVGMRGERVAAKFLKRNDFQIIRRNLKTKFGEVDILAIAPDKKSIVVVEVKSAKSVDSILPEIRVNYDKQRRLTALAAQIVKRHRLTHLPMRFDVVSVRFQDKYQKPIIRHYPGAFNPR